MSPRDSSDDSRRGNQYNLRLRRISEDREDIENQRIVNEYNRNEHRLNFEYQLERRIKLICIFILLITAVVLMVIGIISLIAPNMVMLEGYVSLILIGLGVVCIVLTVAIPEMRSNQAQEIVRAIVSRIKLR